jgi:hypothetical protein
MSLPYGDADLPFLLEDCGVLVATATTGSPATHYGILDKADKMIVSDEKRGEITATVPSVLIQVSAFPAADIAIDAPITVDGVNYVVRDHDAESDGALKKLWLRAV